MKIINPHSQGIRTLYHYQSYKKEWLEHLLSENKIRMSDIDKFNDPWDCNINFSCKNLDKPEVRKNHAKWLDVSCKRIGQIDKDHDSRIKEAENNTSFLQKLLSDFNSKRRLSINDQYKAYCLSEESNVPLMWSHYANKHEDVCLEFSCDNEIFCCAFKIQYKNEYPELYLYDETPEGNLLSVLIKADFWRYEKEWRLISQERKYANTDDMLISNDNYLDIPKTALKAVILGCRMNKEKSEEIAKIVNTMRPDIKIKRSIQLDDCFGLSIVDVV